jgi:hypothetical protein
LLVVEQQGAHIPAEWLLLSGGLFRGGAGASSDLGIALALLHGCVGRGDRCQTNCCRASGDGQWRDIAQFHLLSSYLGDIARYGGGLHVSAGVGIGHAIREPQIAVGPLYAAKTIDLCVPDDPILF